MNNVVAVFSRRDAVAYVPPGSPRSYDLAPLSFRERQAMRAEQARQGFHYPSQRQVIDGLRAAVRELAPANTAELLAVIEAAEATPDDADAKARLLAVEMAVSDVPVYASLVAARGHYLAMLPWFFARYALRGWAGPDLPEFQRVRGLVPDELLEAIPADEFEALGWHASNLAEPGAAARGNSEAPSPSPASQTLSTEG